MGLTFNLLLEARADDKPDHDGGQHGEAKRDEDGAPPGNLVESQH